MKQHQRGKALERAVAAEIGGKRVGVTGLATPDVIIPGWALECKERKELPAWLTDAMVQAEFNGGLGVAAAVVLHPLGGRYDDDLVVMRFDLWRDMVLHCVK